ncbi:MAG: hypothetical protein ACK5KL_08345 [Dysgonomonas sp.]
MNKNNDLKVNGQYSTKQMLRTLPDYLYNDIIAFIKGYKEQVTIVDCLNDEIQGSINLAFYSGQITDLQAEELRERFLYSYGGEEYE